MLAFSSDNLSSNPAEAYIFSVQYYLKRTKINKKEAGLDPFLKKPDAHQCFKYLVCPR